MLHESGLVYKYFDLIDGFIRVRILSSEEALRLPSRAEGLLDRRDYRRLVVQACVVGLEEAVLPRVQQVFPDDTTSAEDLLYQICVDVNPRLEIHSVSLPAHDGASAEGGRGLEWPDLALLERRLLDEVVGQDPHVRSLVQAVRRAAVGLNDPSRPLASYLMVGRTGVGKTQLAKSLARHLCGEDGLVRIDCSEFALPHETAKLIGAPPGYVGHNEGGALTEALQRQPRCVVLFDEVEKGHEKLHNMLLQILDEGRLTDSKGVTVSFQQAIVLLTSNVGTADYREAATRMGFQRGGELGEQDYHQLTEAALRREFKPELLNRLDGVMVFAPLGHEHCRRIAARKLEEIRSRLRGAGVHFRWTPRLTAALAEEGYSEEYGAREVRRTIARLVEEPLSNGVLDGRFPAGARVLARWRGGQVLLECEARPEERRKSA